MVTVVSVRLPLLIRRRRRCPCLSTQGRQACAHSLNRLPFFQPAGEAPALQPEMTKPLSILIASAMTFSTAAQVWAIDANRPDLEQQHEHGHEQEKEGKQKYTCPMHPEVVTEQPGNCPKCGMKLVPERDQKRSTPNAQRSTSNHQSHLSHQSHQMHEHGMSSMQMPMQSSIDLADPMSREGSGTSWLPDSSPMYGKMFMFGRDMLMLHGAIFPRYTNVSTRRGDDRIDAPNWIMGMYSHPLGDATQIGGRLMMSLDPLTEGGRGYPLLFQTGESWHDQPLHDRQHPHDLFDELSVSLSQKFDHNLSAYIYFGYPGEPALGPPVFMHRPSAMDDPDAPIGHHWQDSTHITFGVATAGLVWSRFGGIKVEGRTLPKISRCKVRTATSKVRKRSSRISSSIAPRRRFFITSR